MREGKEGGEVVLVQKGIVGERKQGWEIAGRTTVFVQQCLAPEYRLAGRFDPAALFPSSLTKLQMVPVLGMGHRPIELHWGIQGDAATMLLKLRDGRGNKKHTKIQKTRTHPGTGLTLFCGCASREEK